MQPHRKMGASRRLAALAMVLAVILTVSPLLVTAQDAGRPAAPVVTEPGVRGPAIVQTDAGTDPAAVAAENGIQTGFVYRNVANGFSANLTDANVAALQQDANVESISIDRIVSTNVVPNQLLRVGADTSATGGVGRGGDNSGVGIAIVDSGVGPHPDLNIAGGVDCTGSGSYSDGNGHGTHVAGIAAARDNADSTTGSAPGARVYSVRVLVGTTGSVSAVLCGLDWIAANPAGINVVNMSLGLSQGPGAACGQSTTFPLRQAVCDVRDRGIQVVTAAGNLATNSANYSPASYPEVIAVSAYSDTDGRTGGRGAACSGGDDQFATYSNYNADIMAPGSCITSTAPGGGTAVKSGTSMAAPLVAGALAVNGSLGAISIPRTDLRGAVGSGDPSVLYVGDGTIPGGGTTATATATPTRAATATATRAATATATRAVTATATRAAATATRAATATATRAATTATPFPTRAPRSTATRAASATATRAATATATRAATATATRAATATATRAATATATRAATATATRAATTATVAATATLRPTATATLRPTATATLRPTAMVTGAAATATLRPTATVTRAAATATRAAATATLRPTATPYPTRPPRTLVQANDATRVSATRAPRSLGQAAIPPTATVIPPTATAIPPTATAVPPTATAVPPTATLVPTIVPTDVPTQVPTATPTEEPTLVPTEVPTQVPTDVPTLEPTLEPTVVPTELPTEEPTVVPTEIPAIPPANVTDTYFTGAGWFAVDGDPTTTWYMDVPAPVIAQPAPVEPVDETGVPTDGLPEGVPVENVPADVPVAPIAEPEDLVLVIDLGYVQTVGSARWQWTETVYARGVEVQISLDGQTWTTVAWPDTWSAIPGEWQEAAIGLDAQYVRFLFPNAEQLNVVGGLSEVEVLPIPVP